VWSVEQVRENPHAVEIALACRARDLYQQELRLSSAIRPVVTPHVLRLITA
jgi:hypothetical protein